MAWMVRAHTVHTVPPIPVQNVYMYVDQKDLAAVLTVKRSAGVAPGILPGFETQGRCHQKTKTRVPVAP